MTDVTKIGKGWWGRGEEGTCSVLITQV